MIIRSAAHDDICSMVLLLEELFSIEDDFVIDADKQFRGLKLLLEEFNSIVRVAEIEQHIVGMISIQKQISTAMGDYVGLIEDVIVKEEYRGRGIGKRLLEEAMIESEKRGLKRLALGVDIRNHAAIGFYQKHGFVTSNMGLMYRI